MELKVLFLFFWYCLVPVQSSVIQKKFHYHSDPKTWLEAQQFCEQTYRGDLAIVESNADLTGVNLEMYDAWMGLRKMSGSWEWVVSQEHLAQLPINKKSMLLTVSGDEPGKDCGKFQYSKGNAFAENCDQKHFVVCEDDKYNKIFYPLTMSWLDGLIFCESKSLLYMDPNPSKTTLTYGDSIVNDQQDFPVWISLNHENPALNPGPGSGLCLTVSSKDKLDNMEQKNCSESYPFICEQNNLVLLKEELTWEDAFETCRNRKNTYNQASFSLLSVDEDELYYVQSYAQGATTSKVWVGLRFLAGSWFWFDSVTKTIPSLPYFDNSSCPGFHLGCGALVVDFTSISGAVFEATDCSEKLNVFCYDSRPQWD